MCRNAVKIVSGVTYIAYMLFWQVSTVGYQSKCTYIVAHTGHYTVDHVVSQKKCGKVNVFSDESDWYCMTTFIDTYILSLEKLNKEQNRAIYLKCSPHVMRICLSLQKNRFQYSKLQTVWLCVHSCGYVHIGVSVHLCVLLKHFD